MSWLAHLLASAPAAASGANASPPGGGAAPPNVTREVQRHAPTKTKAERVLAEAVRDRTRHDNSAEIRPDMRVAALAEAWFRDVSSGDRSPSTLVQYRYRLDRQIIPALGELRIRELTPGTIDR